MRHHYPIAAAPRQGHSYAERWEGPDKGLLCCWLRGIEKGREDPHLAAQCLRGELPVLAWKGGIEKALKSKALKVGSMQYLATWQGLRGEDLDIDDEAEPRITCTRTGVTFLYTLNTAKLLNAGEEAPA